MNKLFIILGNQLFNPKFFEKYKEHTFFLAEDYGLCTYEKHHKHKILLFLSAMRSFCDELEAKKFKVEYIKIEDPEFEKSYEEKIIKILEKLKIQEISMFEIEDKSFESRLINLFKKIKIKFRFIETPMFINSRKDFGNYLSASKKPFMANFYKKQRLKNNILVDQSGNPTGGKWSFDQENRKKIPKDIKLPNQLMFKNSSHTHDLKKIINIKFKSHPGNLDDFWIGTTRKDAEKCLKNFIEKKINLFGDYEDAVDQRDNILFHSALSPLINIGLITPTEIIQTLMKSVDNVKLNSLEGYIRQLIGWREFMRGIYQNFSESMEESNFFGHKRRMKDSWYLGKTGLEPLDKSINNASKFGWTHHIERLMILSNIMNLCEINPKQVYRWFMEMFIDSSEWVMVPNVYGMGLFSDGGIFATKPYICGSSYFLKMMDFKKGDWCDIMDGLYWRFIENNEKFFLKNPRLSMMVRVLKKINPERKQRIFVKAEKFIEANTYEN